MSILWDELDNNEQETTNQRVARLFLADDTADMASADKEVAKTVQHFPTVINSDDKYQAVCTGKGCDWKSQPVSISNVAIHDDLTNPENMASEQNPGGFTPEDVTKAQHDAAHDATLKQFSTHAISHHDDTPDVEPSIDVTAPPGKTVPNPINPDEFTEALPRARDEHTLEVLDPTKIDLRHDRDVEQAVNSLDAPELHPGEENFMGRLPNSSEERPQYSKPGKGDSGVRNSQDRPDNALSKIDKADAKVTQYYTEQNGGPTDPMRAVQDPWTTLRNDVETGTVQPDDPDTRPVRYPKTKKWPDGSLDRPDPVLPKKPGE